MGLADGRTDVTDNEQASGIADRQVTGLTYRRTCLYDVMTDRQDT